MILLIDNQDSFVANIARYFRRMELETCLISNSEVDREYIELKCPQAIVISPGPCTPNEAGYSMDAIRHFAGKIPILGICLGHQAIGAVYGADIVRASEPVHGRQSTLTHNDHFLFDGVPRKFDACRYHSLVIDEKTLSQEFQVTCRTIDQTIMAVAHDELKLFGLQFHPESILTPFGFNILQNFARQFDLFSQEQTNPNRLFESESGSTRQLSPSRVSQAASS